MFRKIVMIANGPRPDEKDFRQAVESANFLIAIDGGLQHCHEFQITPDLILGDFDSIDPKLLSEYQQKSEIYKFPTHKDFTDLELGLFEGVQRGATHFQIFSWSDERLDHSLNPVLTAASLKAQVEFFTPQSRLHLLNKFHPRFQLTEIGKKISIFPLTAAVSLKSFGLRWELNWKNVSLETRSQSNEIIATGKISLTTGAAFVLIEK